VLKHGEEKNFAVVDAAMNDLARPALYDAWHEIIKVGADKAPALQGGRANNALLAVADGETALVVEPPSVETAPAGKPPTMGTAPTAPLNYEIVGPICESGDFLGHDRNLALAEGDLLAVLSAGAYGMAMSSNYNTRPRAAEVMVDGDSLHLIRRREEIPQLFALESVLP
jgi:diaminopimelate decarboxylase